MKNSQFRVSSGLLLPVCLAGLSLSLSAQVADPFGRSVTDEQKTGPSITLGDGAKKTLPPIGEKGAKKPGTSKGGGPESFTEITSTLGLKFDQKGSQATFTGDVVVTDSRFSLNCDKLTAVLRRSLKDALKEEGEGAAPLKPGREVSREAAKPGANPKPSAGGIEKAIAEGHVVIAQEKINDKGESERSVGRAHKAVYDADSGDITLSGWPQLEQKTNTIVALEEGTVIVLNRKGALDVQGQSKTVLRNTSVDDGR